MKYTNLLSILLLTFLSFSHLIFSQEDELLPPATTRTSGKAQAFGKELYVTPVKGFAYRFTGQTTLEGAYDSRQIQAFFQDSIAYFPLPITFDPRGLDVFDKDQATLVGLSVSARTLFIGPSIWGATTNGRVDLGFGGLSDKTIWIARLSNAYINFIWRRSTELRIGHYYHPMALAKVYPTNVNGGEGIGYDPSRKSPIIRIRHNTGNWKFVFAIAKQFNSEASRWAVLPDLFFQLNFYQHENMYGAGVCYRAEVPRVETDFGYKTTEQLNMLYTFAFARIVHHLFIIKARVTYLENGPAFGTIGGYAVADRNTITDNRQLVPLRNMTFWVEAIFKGSKTLEPAVFVGLSKALGAASKIIKCYRNEDGADVNLSTGITNVNYMFALAPRLRAVFKSLILGFEVEYTRAAFARASTEQGWQNDYDEYGKIVNSKASGNLALYFTASYSF